MVTDMLNTPTSVSFDADGMMYICDMAHGAICECPNPNSNLRADPNPNLRCAVR